MVTPTSIDLSKKVEMLVLSQTIKILIIFLQFLNIQSEHIIKEVHFLFFNAIHQSFLLTLEIHP